MPGKTLLAGLFLAAACCAPACVAAGEIHGTLRLPGAGPRTRAVSSGGFGPAALPANLVTEAVVYLDTIPDKLEKKLARTVEAPLVAQCYGTFIPSALSVAAGTTVIFENQDRVYHNVFSRSPGHSFDLGKYAPRERRSVTFDTPGVAQVFCDIDPDETAYILVTPNHAFTHPDVTGAFSLPKLPPGRYTLRVWHPLLGTTRREIEMPRRGDIHVALKL